LFYFISIFLLCVLVYEYRMLTAVYSQSRLFLLRRPSWYFGVGILVSLTCCGLLAEKKVQVCGVALLTFFLLGYYFRRKSLFVLLNKQDAGMPWGLFSRGWKGSISTASQPLVSNAISVVMIWFFVMTASSFLFYLMARVPKYDNEAWQILCSTIISSFVLLILIRRAVGKYSQGGFACGLALIKKGVSFFKLFIFPACIGLLIAFISARVIVARPIDPHTPLSELLMASNSLFFVGVFIFLAVIIAPFVEEVVFRGYFFHVLSVAKSKRFALYTIAISFGALHFYQYWGDWPAMLIVMLLGFVLTLMRMYTNSTISSIVLHYVYNGGVMCMTAILLFIANPPFAEYQAYS